MTSKLFDQKTINAFRIIGHLTEEPVKDYNELNKIVVFFKIKTRFNNTSVTLPMMLTGSKCDAFATTINKGDLLKVDGMFMSLDNKVQLFVTGYALLKKNSKQLEVEDKFKKIVELYSLEGIERRSKNDK